MEHKGEHDESELPTNLSLQRSVIFSDQQGRFFLTPYCSPSLLRFTYLLEFQHIKHVGRNVDVKKWTIFRYAKNRAVDLEKETFT